ncbi:hypothetical protein HYY69_04305 [Candidatus Woesearchaeota archaeon]|nr:hypothetical protein [Candidatus Woesearchaeota archaeon]
MGELTDIILRVGVKKLYVAMQAYDAAPEAATALFSDCGNDVEALDDKAD